MNTIDDLVSRLAAHKGHWPYVARSAQVPVSTVRKIAQGYTKNPRFETVTRLRKALRVLPA